MKFHNTKTNITLGLASNLDSSVGSRLLVQALDAPISCTIKSNQTTNSRLKSLASILAFSLFSPAVISAPPVAFGSSGCPSGFVCEDNVVSNGMVQRMLTDGAGATYFRVTINDGITNDGGSFFYDAFTNASNGNTQGGISARLDIRQTGVENMDYSTILNVGWANDGSPAIDISQAITDRYQDGDFDYSFKYKQTQNVQGGMTGYYYEIFERVTNSSGTGSDDIHTFVLRRAAGDFVQSGSVTLEASGGGGMDGGGGGMMKATVDSVTSSGISSAATTSLQDTFVPDSGGYGTDGYTTGTIGDPQTPTGPAADTLYGEDANAQFIDTSPDGTDSETVNLAESNTMNSVYTNNIGAIISDGIASGDAAPTSEIFVDTGSGGGMGGGGGPGGGTVSWNTGDEIQVLWIGQTCPSCDSGGMMSGGGSFSFQQYENLSNGDFAASRMLNSTAPLNWLSDPFGNEPQL